MDYGELLQEVRARWGDPMAIAFDTWKMAKLKESLEDIGFPVVPLVLRRQGFKDGSDDLKEFRRGCIDQEVSPRRSLLLRSSMSGARVTSDVNANFKLTKGGQGRKLRARDDCVAAMILAVAEGRRWSARQAQKKGFSYAIL